MDYETLLMNMINNRLTREVSRNAQITEREDRSMPDSTRRAFESRMRSDTAVARMASQNMEDAESMVTVAQTGVTAIKSQLQKIQEILTDCAETDFMTQDELDSAQAVIQERTKEIERIAGNTTFNGMSLLNGTAGNGGVVQLQAGSSTRNQKFINLLDGSGTVLSGSGTMDLRAATLDSDLTGSPGAFTQAIAQQSLTNISKYIDRIGGIEGQYSYDIRSLDNLRILFEEQADIYEAAGQRSLTSTNGTSSTSNRSSCDM